MAKREYRLQGSFDDILNTIHSGILRASSSASYEDGSEYSANGVRCAVRVYERYSYLGKNRVSMNLTIVGPQNGELFLSAITSGGSQAVFFKVNTFGEEAFIDTLDDVVRRMR